MEKHIDISGAFKFGWAKFKENWQFLLIAGVIIYGVGGLLRVWVENTFRDQEPVLGILNFLLSFATMWLYFNALRALIGIVDSRPPKVADLFSYDKSFWSYVLGAILYGLLVGFGFILLIIPGIYLAVRFGLYLYAIADKKLGPIEALKESSRLTYGVRWELLLFNVVCILAVIAGFVALLVGVFVAMPVVALATVYVYRELTNQTKEPVEVTVSEPAAPAVPADTPATPPASSVQSTEKPTETI